MKMTTAKAAKKGAAHGKKSGKKRAVRHVVTKPAKNGFLTETHYLPNEGENEFGMEPDVHVHDSAEQAGNHVASMFGGDEEAGETPAEQAAEGPAGEKAEGEPAA